VSSLQKTINREVSSLQKMINREVSSLQKMINRFYKLRQEKNIFLVKAANFKVQDLFPTAMAAVHTTTRAAAA